MQWINDIYTGLCWRIIRNRSGYTDSEIDLLKKIPWMERSIAAIKKFYRFRVEIVKANRCSIGWKEGDRLYFDFSGMLIKRKCPSLICPHAIAALSPAIYACVDRISRGADPSIIHFDHVSCTDPGFDKKGLGNNLMRITCEKAPLWENMINTILNFPSLFFRNWKVRGKNPGGLL